MKYIPIFVAAFFLSGCEYTKPYTDAAKGVLKPITDIAGGVLDKLPDVEVKPTPEQRPEDDTG